MGPSANVEQLVRASLLRGGNGIAPAPRLVVHLPVHEKQSRLQFARELLSNSGIKETSGLASLPGLPEGRWLCRIWNPVFAGSEQVDSPTFADPLLNATILGLCNSAFYSSERPIIWTESRLLRQVELFQLSGFYED